MKYIKKILPPEFIRLVRHTTCYGGCFRGEYATWEEAAGKAEGYNADIILKCVLEATLAVRDGKAQFERDGVILSHFEYPYPVLATLMRAAALNDRRLRVLDFGGALGSTYFQCRSWLKDVELTWCVVEQAHFAKAGNDALADGRLVFSDSIAKVSEVYAFDVVIFSGVLQYIPNFAEVFSQALALQPRFIIIDRTPTIAGDKDVIAVQKQGLSSRLVRSSYPVRLFARANLLLLPNADYTLLSEFSAVDEPMGGLNLRVDFKGFIWKRN